MRHQYITMVLYDLPTSTKRERYHYLTFRKDLKALGFYQLQQSVYLKKLYSREMKSTIINQLNNILPKKGDVRLITFTLKQFNKSSILLGTPKFCEELFSPDNTIIDL